MAESVQPSFQVGRRNLGLRRQIVLPRIASHDKHGVDSADTAVFGIVELRVLHSTSVQFLQSFISAYTQLFQRTKLDRLGRTSLRARRMQSHLLPVVAKCALERPPIVRITLDHTERTGHHAVSAAVAHVRLHKHSAEFGANDRSCRARFQASRLLTVLTHVRGKLPCHVSRIVAAEAGLGLSFYKLDVAPRRVANRSGVVIRISGPVQSIRGDAVPFLAGHFAGLTANA